MLQRSHCIVEFLQFPRKRRTIWGRPPLMKKSLSLPVQQVLLVPASVRYLNDQGFYNLLLVDDIKKTQKWKNLLLRNRSISSLAILFEWLKGRETEVGAFIHLGACSDTMEMDGDYLMENNFRYTKRLAEYALKTWAAVYLRLLCCDLWGWSSGFSG